MPKTAISVTLDGDNLLWLKGRAAATGSRSVSDLLDRLVAEARAGGAVGPVKSVVGTIDIDPEDASLAAADEAIRAMFDESLRRPLIARERRPRDGGSRRPPEARQRKRRG